MSNADGYVRHPVRLVFDLAAALVGFIMFTLGVIVFAYRVIAAIVAVPIYTDYLLLGVSAFNLLVFAAFSVLTGLGVRSMWFVQYKYRLIDGVLEVIDPVLRKQWIVQMDAVHRVRSFVILQGSRDTRYRVGHLLDVQDGVTVPVSEALPLWTEIVSRCVTATFEERPTPWWEIRR